LEIDGSLDTISAPVGTAMYRIVQESLTNVMRHAPEAAARVTIRRTADHGVRLEVCDDGAGRGGNDATNVAGSGMGIRGMRERAESSGGVLETGPRPHGGYRVIATWPAT
jgi:signal transduction histidine kinase